MSEEMLVKHCSPTLAGIKTGNLFSCPFSNEYEIKESVRYWNRLLTSKGLRIIPMRFRNGHALIYVYRPSKLKTDLKNSLAVKLLHERGYCTDTSERCVVCLTKRICEYGEFPHEIGLFLGYPPEDVCGFIKNKADGCKFVGYWKVYGDAENAQKTFDQFKKCTDVYCEQFAKGKSIERLAVNG